MNTPSKSIMMISIARTETVINIPTKPYDRIVYANLIRVQQNVQIRIITGSWLAH